MVARRSGAFAVGVATALVAGVAPGVAGNALPAADRRVEVRTLDTPWHFDPPGDAAAWQARARVLREQVLVAAGLWPLPEKRPLHAQVFGRLERGDHSVEKVYFESHPGFYVTGNLYRPLGRTGPFPGVLSPHGHWDYGRLENGALGSEPGRAISLARQGYVVFTYDMVGYNDSGQVDHRLLDPRLAQWGIGSLSLHLWNSIRSLDFLESLPDVDRSRLACTGASGGGTQTFLLAAVDERVRVAAPVNMISHTMQGGDVCENAPNLRLDASNMELAALTAPRPMIMVSATGDWTKDTPRVEFPAVQAIYRLLGAGDRVETVQIDADHNYNRESREAVYAFFGRHVLGLGAADASALREREYEPALPSQLLVFHGRMFSLRRMGLVYWVQMISHRLLRYGSGVLHLVLLATSVVLALAEGGIYWWVLGAQALFAALVLLSIALRGRVRLLAIPHYYGLVTWATVVALYVTLTRGVPAVWERAEGTR
jgi:dienelactone hydrolase